MAKSRPTRQIDLNSIKGKVQNILSKGSKIIGDLHRQVLDANGATPPTLSREELETYPFTKTLRRYAKLTDMGPFQLHHEFDNRGVGTISTTLAHPTRFGGGAAKLHIDVIGNILDSYSDDHNSPKGFSGHGAVRSISLLVGSKKDEFSLPVNTPAGKFTVYFRPVVSPISASSFVEAFQKLSTELKNQIQEAVTSYVSNRGTKLPFTTETLEATVQELLGAFCMTEEYVTFLAKHIE